MSAVTLRGICAAAVFFGILLALLPEGRERRITSLCATAALVVMFLGLVLKTDWEGYAISLSQTRDAAAMITSSAEESRSRMNRLVIEQECEEYIMDKAADLGIPIHGVKVNAAWKKEGVWVPDFVTIKGAVREDDRERLSLLIEAELGIGQTGQEWEIEEDP